MLPSGAIPTAVPRARTTSVTVCGSVEAGALQRSKVEVTKVAFVEGSPLPKSQTSAPPRPRALASEREEGKRVS